MKRKHHYRAKRARRSSRDIGDTISKARGAIARIDRLLSAAEDIIGRELSTTELREEAPKTFEKADKAFSFIERARRALGGMR